MTTSSETERCIFLYLHVTQLFVLSITMSKFLPFQTLLIELAISLFVVWNNGCHKIVVVSHSYKDVNAFTKQH